MLDLNERVTILYHGKGKGVIVPVNKRKQNKVSNDPIFGLNKQTSSTVPVEEQMDILRNSRYT